MSRGKQLFQAKCAACHTLAEAGASGKVGPNLDDAFGSDRAQGFKEAHALFDDLAKAGVDYDDVTETLELEGVQKFADSFTELLEGVRAKRGELAAA